MLFDLAVLEPRYWNYIMGGFLLRDLDDLMREGTEAMAAAGLDEASARALASELGALLAAGV